PVGDDVVDECAAEDRWQPPPGLVGCEEDEEGDRGGADEAGGDGPPPAAEKSHGFSRRMLAAVSLSMWQRTPSQKPLGLVLYWMRMRAARSRVSASSSGFGGLW